MNKARLMIKQLPESSRRGSVYLAVLGTAMIVSVRWLRWPCSGCRTGC